MSQNTAKPLKALDLSTWSLIRRLAGAYILPYAKRIAIALFFMCISAAMTATFAKLIQPILDVVLVKNHGAYIIPMASAVFVVFLINGMSTYVHTVLMDNVGQAIVADIQKNLFWHFMGLDLKFFHTHHSGQLVARVISDVNALRAAVSDTLTGIGKSSLTLAMLMGLMFWQDWRLSLITIVVFPIAGYFVSRLGHRLRKVSHSIQNEIGMLSATMIQIFQGMRQVKAYGMEDFERQRTGKAIENVRRLMFKITRIGNMSTPVNETLIGLALAGVLTYGGYQVVGGHLTIGELMSFIAAFALAYEPLKRIAKLNNALQTGLGAAERVLDMMDQRAQIVDNPDAASVTLSKAPEIVFNRVVFHYGEIEKLALRGVSFTLPAGKVTALVGPSGGGKTTVMNMIPRLYDVVEGRVLLDGRDLRDITLESLRRHIALVSQDITIFDESVRANIAYGRPGASDDEIGQAAKDAAADEFIRMLPEDYETRLGEHGVKLSGGQRQRIAIARAILRDAPILLLDEATSALDTESERLIQDSLKRLQRGRTTLVIAHRLSTVQDADQIIVLDRGEVVEQGTHAELLKERGLYSRMHSAGLKEQQAA